MITPEQRRKMESEWSSDERSMARIGRLARAAVMLMLILGLAWIGASDKSLNASQEAAVAKPALSAIEAREASAVPASRDTSSDIQHVQFSR